MKVLRWNDPINGIVRIGLRGDWPNVAPAFNFNGKDYPTAAVLPVIRQQMRIDWVFNAGQPPDFSYESVMRLREIVRDVFAQLVGWGRLNALENLNLGHLFDTENWNGYPAASYADAFCKWFSLQLREAGFRGPIGNYATVPLNMSTKFPCAQTQAGGIDTPVLSGYGISAPDQCYAHIDIMRNLRTAMLDRSRRVWVVLSEYNDNDTFRDVAALNPDTLFIWVDEAKRAKTLPDGSPNPTYDPAFVIRADSRLKSLLPAS